MRRLDTLLLAGVGILAIHQFAYAATALLGVASTVSHGHLDILSCIVGLLAVIGVGNAVTRSLRSRHHEPMGAGHLAFTLALGFTGLEIVERIAEGFGPTQLLSESVFWIGLAMALPVAFVLRVAVASVVEFALAVAEVGDDALFSGRQPSLSRFGRTSTTLAPIALRSSSVSRRGPPHVR